MMSWFARRRTNRDAPRLSPRGAVDGALRVEFGELTPETLPFLGQAAYIQLEGFEALARAIGLAPSLAAKERVSPVAAIALDRHRALIAEIRREGGEPSEVMAPFAEAVDAFRARAARDEWLESILGIHITSGMLGDFFETLARSLPHPAAERVSHILDADDGGDILRDELRAAIAGDPVLASRLALWGRRLVGDTLLLARSALRGADAAQRGGAIDERVEPVFTELIAAHTRRMDALGLTA